MFRTLLALFLLALACSVPAQEPITIEPGITFQPTPTPPAHSRDPNSAILAAIDLMPTGGRYSASSAAFQGLGHAVQIGANGLRLDPQSAEPSFCSGATYLVFLAALDQLSRSGAITLDAATLNALLVAHQRDGQGIWGRWNANGPGTARLFTELHLGRNFTDFAEARPGDFMKIFWTDEIGQKEHGHSVIFLGSSVVNGQDFVRFWSSNMASGPGDLSGYGKKVVPRSRIARVIFSRLETPENIVHLRTIPPTDSFLASLLSRRVSIDEVRRMCEF